MKLVIFGLTVSSSWGNGHATLWRGLFRSLAAHGVETHFFERDVPYYAAHRDLLEVEGARLHLYPDWDEIAAEAGRQMSDADVTMVTSYCPDALAAADLAFESPALHTFYDLDTGVTLERLAADLPVDYIGERGLRDFDLVFSYNGGRSLDELKTKLGAREAVAIYGSVDPAAHHPAAADARFRSDVSYLGTYAEDRQAALERLFIEPARRMPARTFRIGGALYPAEFPWSANICFDRHLPPSEHPAFYCSSRMTLNVTRRSMAAMGYCPSGRFFEAAACEVPVLTDEWEGLETFFEPGREVLVARTTEEAMEAIGLPDGDLRQIGRAARQRAMQEHTADARVKEMLKALEASRSAPAMVAAPGAKP